MKTCRTCNQDKPESDFPVQRSKGYVYLHTRCKKCSADNEKERRWSKIEEIRQKDRDRWVHNRDKMRARSSEAYYKNRDRILKKLRDEYVPSPRKRPTPKALSLIGLRCKLRDTCRAYIIRGIGRLMSSIIGCSQEKARSHLHHHFSPGMTWDNFGSVWHIDHYIPLSYFDMTDSFDVKCGYNWRNLRPLFAADNIKKKAILPSDHEVFLRKLRQEVCAAHQQ